MERDSWQHCVSSYLQRNLKSLVVVDPFFTHNSNDFVLSLVASNLGQCNMFSIDVEDLYYNLPHDALMENEKLCITEDSNEMAFSSACGVSVGAFLEILSLYLASTRVEWKENILIEK